MPFLLSVILLILPIKLMAGDSPTVITSIHPIHLITNEIMRGAGQSDLLIQNDQSPHHFQLKPSQLKKVTQADLLIWISNEFETGLNRLQTILSSQTEQLELVRNFPPENLIEDHHAIDGHIWLSPENVALIAQTIAQKLSSLDPLNGQLYLNNAEKLIAKLAPWKQRSLQLLSGIKPRYILDHQFLAYFERSFGLKNMGSLRNNHDHGSSIRRISRLNQQLKDSPAKCLVVASLPLSQQAQQIKQKHQLKTVVINLLTGGNDHENISGLLDNIVKNLSSCQ